MFKIENMEMFISFGNLEIFFFFQVLTLLPENTTNPFWESHSFWDYMWEIFCWQNTGRLSLKLAVSVC